MYTVMIVDDESWVVENIKASVNWEQLGFQVVAQAYSGMEALSWIQELKPDLVLTDIRMQGLDGLELIRRSGELAAATRFIVISGHAEFEYAQRAINYGAIGYCLKPLDDKEIYEQLVKAKALLQSTVSPESRLIEFMEDKSKNDWSPTRLFEEFGIGGRPSADVVMVVSIGSGNLVLSDDVPILSFQMGVQRKLNLIRTASQTGLAEQLQASLSDQIAAIGIGKVVRRMEELGGAFEEASAAAYHCFITGKKDVYTLSDIQLADSGIFLQQLENDICSRDIDALRSTFHSIREYVTQGLFSIRHALRLYDSIMYFLFKIGKEAKEDYLFNYEQLISRYKDVSDLLDGLERFVEQQLATQLDLPPNKVKGETFKAILLYVNENFRENISIQSIIQKFYINPSYVSQLFKKQTGRTFTQYLYELRIKYACELLKNSELPIHEVSVKSGYDDYFYFNKIFKKVTGKTPLQFRSQAN